MKSRRGGARKGAGRKPGSKWPSTITKEQARDALRVMVLKHMTPLVQAQIAHSLGIGHLYTRDKTGKFNKIESEAEVDRLLSEGKEDRDYWIFTKDPSVQAFTDLMNRALDKPKDQAQEIVVTATLEVIPAKLQAARKRLAAQH